MGRQQASERSLALLGSTVPRRSASRPSSRSSSSSRLGTPDVWASAQGARHHRWTKIVRAKGRASTGRPRMRERFHPRPRSRTARAAGKCAISLSHHRLDAGRRTLSLSHSPLRDRGSLLMYETVRRGRATMQHKDLAPLHRLRSHSLHRHHSITREKRATEFGRARLPSSPRRQDTIWAQMRTEALLGARASVVRRNMPRSLLSPLTLITNAIR